MSENLFTADMLRPGVNASMYIKSIDKTYDLWVDNIDPVNNRFDVQYILSNHRKTSAYGSKFTIQRYFNIFGLPSSLIFGSHSISAMALEIYKVNSIHFHPHLPRFRYAGVTQDRLDEIFEDSFGYANNIRWKNDISTTLFEGVYIKNKDATRILEHIR